MLKQIVFNLRSCLISFCLPILPFGVKLCRMSLLALTNQYCLRNKKFPLHLSKPPRFFFWAFGNPRCIRSPNSSGPWENSFTVQKRNLEYTMNSVSVAKNWFSSLFTNNLIRLMSKQYLQFRHEHGGGTGHAKKAVSGTHFCAKRKHRKSKCYLIDPYVLKHFFE